MGSTLPIGGCLFGVLNAIALIFGDAEDQTLTGYPSHIDPLPPWLSLYADYVVPFPLAIMFCFILFGVQSFIASCILEFYARPKISSKTQHILTCAALGCLATIPWLLTSSYSIAAIFGLLGVTVGAIVGIVLWRYRNWV